MTLLNVSFGLAAFFPPGWVFIAFVMVIECWLAARYLTKQNKFNRRISATVITSNIFSGFIGVIASLLATGGWWLVLYIPWVSRHEVSVHNPWAWVALTVYYLLAFILSVLIEGAVNTAVLKDEYPKKEIRKCTLYINAVSYACGSLVLYLISFKIL